MEQASHSLPDHDTVLGLILIYIGSSNVTNSSDDVTDRQMFDF